jgi:hypothetical protein
MHKSPVTIAKEIPPVGSRMLSPRWKRETVVWPRANVPKDLDLTKFPHVWEIPDRASWSDVEQWCITHLGPVDDTWTWTDTLSMRFVDDHVPLQLSLIF